MVDAKRLSGAVRAKRGRMSLRKAGEKSGVSYVVLQRIENEEGTPDLATFIRLCDWLEAPMEHFTAREQAA